MEKKILTLMVAVIAGIIIGVALAVQRTTNPVIIEQLSGIGRSLKNIEKLAEIADSVKIMEGRLAMMETQTNTIIDEVKRLQLPPQRMAQQPPPPPSEDFSKVYDLDIAHARIQGNKNAAVTIVEFVDFQCPFCQRFHPVVTEVLKTYPKDVNYVLRNYPLPFHPQARPAAKAALAAGEQGKYFEMADLLLQSGANLNEDKFQELAKSLGLNVSKFMKDYKEKDTQWEEVIKKDMELATKVDVRGTPTYYINGHKTMARDLNSYKTEIDKILEELKKKH